VRLAIRESDQGGGLVDVDDYIQQEDGIIVHRGEELDLFGHDGDSDDLSDDGNLDIRDSHVFTMAAPERLFWQLSSA